MPNSYNRPMVAHVILSILVLALNLSPKAVLPLLLIQKSVCQAIFQNHNKNKRWIIPIVHLALPGTSERGVPVGF